MTKTILVYSALWLRVTGNHNGKCHHDQTEKAFAAVFFSVVEKVPAYLGDKSVSKCTPGLTVTIIRRPFALTN